MDIVNLTRKAFTPKGVLSKVLSRSGRDYNFRQEQMDYALAIAQLLSDHDGDRGHIGLLEAETGIGKSLGYLIPAMLRCSEGYTGMVSTYTLNLLDKLVKKDGPLARAVVQELTGKQITIAGRKGIQNFVAKDTTFNLTQEFMQEERDERDIRYLMRLSDWDEDVHEFILKHGPLPEGIALSDVVSTHMSSAEDKVHYEDHIQHSKNADLVVVSHALLVSDAMHWFTILKDDSGYDFCISDEADQLVQVAESNYTCKITVGHLARLGRDLQDAGINTNLNALIEESKSFFNSTYNKNVADNKNFLPLNGLGKDNLSYQAIQSAKNITNELSSHRAKVKSQDLKHRLDYTINGLDIFINSTTRPGGNFFVSGLSWSPVVRYPSFNIVPLHAGRVMARYFRYYDERDAYLNTFICTSATMDAESLTGGVDFKSFRNRMGIFDTKDHHKGYTYRKDLSQLLSPKNYGDMHIHLASIDAPAPFVKEDNLEAFLNPDFSSFCRSHIKELQSQGGRVYVLAHSFDEIEALNLQEADNVFIQKRGESLKNLLEGFVACENATLVTCTGWQGVDLPGMINHLVITRIPFSPVDENTAEAISQAAISRGLSLGTANGMVIAKSVSEARNKLKQGLGRLNRDEDHAGNVYILDRRFPHPGSNDNISFFKTFALSIPKRFRKPGPKCRYSKNKVSLLGKCVL